MMDTRTSMKKFNIHPTKSLGQNFLTDGGIIKRIVDGAEIGSSDVVLEIGPGLGSMTAEIAARAGKVIAVEIDKRLIPVLGENLKEFTNVRVLNKDIMKLDFSADLPELGELQQPPAGSVQPAGSFKIAANLPYYITTPVIMGLLEQEVPASSMVFMVQSEVADRITAKPGGKDYGALSVAVQYFSKPSRLFDVPPHCFVPQPGVDSTVVRFDIYNEPPVSLLDKALFFKTVKAAFGQRRKTLVNALHNSGYFNKDKTEIKRILETVGIEENRRGETLSILQFAELSNCIFRNR